MPATTPTKPAAPVAPPAPPTPDGAAPVAPVTPTSDGAAKTPNGMYVTMPPELYNAIKADAAKSGDIAPASFVRLMLAKHYGVVIETAASTVRHKYSSEAERKAAIETARKEKAALQKKLLAAYKQAMIDAAKTGTAPDLAAVVARVTAASDAAVAPPPATPTADGAAPTGAAS